MLSHLGQVMVQVVDNMMVGRLGKEPLAGASFANSIFVIFLVMGIGMSYAITPMTAQADGENNTTKLTEILKHGFLVNVVFGMLLTGILISSYGTLGYFNQPAIVVELAIPYLGIIAVSLIPFMAFQTFRQFADGLGYTKQSMYITIIGNILNIILNYIFIFGKLGFEPMGLYGAGLATMISRVIMAIMMISFVYFNRRFAKYWQEFKIGGLSGTLIISNLRLGFPMAFQFIFEVSTFSMAAIMIGWLGTGPLAAHQIAISIVSISFMFIVGIATASTIRVSTNMGEEDFIEMKRAGFSAFVLAAIFMAFAAVLFILLKDFLPTLFIKDSEVISIAASLIVIGALFQISDGIQAVGLGVLRGLTDVKSPMLITFIAYWVIGLPSGYYFGFSMEMGAVGVWIGLLIGLSVAAVVLTFRFVMKSNSIILQK